MKILCYGGLLLFHSPLLASINPTISHHFYQEIPHTQRTLQQNLNKMMNSPIKAEDYCNDDTCKTHITQPGLSRYANDPGALKNDSVRQLSANSEASNIKKGFDTRTKQPLNPNDPAYARAKGIMDNSYEISHGLSSKYYNCQTGEECQYQQATRQCSRPTSATPACILDAYPIRKEKQPRIASVRLQGSTTQIPLPPGKIAKLDIPPLTTPVDIIPDLFACRRPSRAMPIDIVVNGRVMGRAQGKIRLTITPHATCAIQFETPATSVTLSPAMPLPALTIQLQPYRGALNALGHGPLTIYSEQDTWVMGWRNNCAAPRECRQVREVCVEGAQTRTISGIEVFLPCWKKARTYQCQYPDTCQALLTGTSPTRCTAQRHQCKTVLFGQCVEDDITLACETQQCTQTQLTCGEQSFCLDGSCYAGKTQKSDTFHSSVSALAGLGQAAKSLTPSPYRIFTGKPAFCDKKPIGFSDCCADSGWGQNTGLAQCSAQEKGLAQAKKKGLTIELGQFCAERVLGVCIRKKKGYCQFDFKMARIIQQQGRPQLGLPFGSAKSPQCQGLTPEQIQQLNFSNIHFGEFYNDLKKSMRLPDMNEVQRRIENKYKDAGRAQP